MDISKTSNMFICLAEALGRSGADMEDVARDLAIAFQAVVADGLNSPPENMLEDAINELRRFTGDR
jgi:hypothetical protein